MSWWYRHVVRPALFKSDSERIHNRTLKGLGWMAGHHSMLGALQNLFGTPELEVQTMGLRFPNPIGLAAGMDKKAEAVPVWEALGFGFCELGGITAHAQPGNPSPRMFRAISDEALVNRMGFNNPGAEAIAERLAEWKARQLWPRHPVGINLGKSKITPLESAADDYAASFRLLKPYADFFVVNVSSPNTPNLRKLQDGPALSEIFSALNDLNLTEAKPILVKVAPDLTFEALDEILEIVSAKRVAGIIATNTTITRPTNPSPRSFRVYKQTGGLSGKPLRMRSTEIVAHIFKQTSGKLPIIGVGGVFHAGDAWEKIIAGATLVQVYTGMVYEGPSIAREIVTGLRELLQEHGFETVQEAVALMHRQ